MYSVSCPDLSDFLFIHEIKQNFFIMHPVFVIQVIRLGYRHDCATFKDTGKWKDDRLWPLNVVIHLVESRIW